jgi:hypothetical protein
MAATERRLNGPILSLYLAAAACFWWGMVALAHSLGRAMLAIWVHGGRCLTRPLGRHLIQAHKQNENEIRK